MEKPTQTNLFKEEGNKYIPFIKKGIFVWGKTKKCAFTLAEVLITLAIIGVVAALMLPTLFTNVNQKVYDAREQNIVQKVTQAMNQMKALGLLSQTYASTEDFVDELTKHLKVTKVCKTNLENCWPTKTVTDASGAEFDVSTV